MITVLIKTYNDEKYIEQCINSVLDQITDFPVKILVNDDASSDDTPNILTTKFGNNPQIELILRDKNLFQNGINPWSKLFDIIETKYIALLDGDDYWIDKYKLKKQVDLMELDYSISMSFTRSYVGFDVGLKPISTAFETDNIVDFDSYLRNYCATPTSTMVLRNLDYLRSKEFKENVSRFSKDDYVLRMFSGFNGKFGFINDFTSVYRKLKTGISSEYHTFHSLIRNKDMNKQLNIISKYKYDYFFGAHEQNMYERLLYAASIENKLTVIPKYWFNSIFNSKKRFVGFKKMHTISKGALKLLIKRQFN